MYIKGLLPAGIYRKADPLYRHIYSESHIFLCPKVIGYGGFQTWEAGVLVLIASICSL